MKILLSIFLIFGLVSICFADRVCLEKSTGKLIEYQSGGNGQDDLDAMVRNAQSAGYNKNDVEVRLVTPEEWKIIKEEWIISPAKEEAKIKEQKRKQKEEAIKIRLNLNEQEWKDLKSALND